jgi:DNA processing protein
MKYEISIIKKSSKKYPPLLKHIIDAPDQLYIRGNADILHSPHLLAVVGSRKASTYGSQAVSRLLTEPIRAGLIVVSGLAYGIDSLSHQAAVAEGKPTIAVLGTGIDDPSIYPRPNKKLAHEILDNGGAIISEYEPGMRAYKGNFPARNRIIAGLSKVTLIVQAALKSGSLITGRLAMESNREVAAVPGNITDPLAEGPNQLIRDGAHCIIEPEDLMLLYGLAGTSKPAEINLNVLTLEHQAIYQLLTPDPQHVDTLTQVTKKEAPKIASLLMELELRGYAQHVGGMQYIRK